MDEDGSFILGGARRRLVARTQVLWLAEDGPAPPRRRLMLPGEWLAHAFSAGLAPLVPVIQTCFAHGHGESLMPHDILDASPVMARLRRLFEDPALAAPIAGNPVARLDRLRTVEEAVTLALGRDARVVFDPSGAGVRVSASFAEAMRAARLHTCEVVLRDTPVGKEALWPEAPGAGAEVDAQGVVRPGAEVGPGSLLVGVSSFVEVPRSRARARELTARYPDGVPRVDRSLRVPPGVSGTVARVDVSRRRGSEPLPREAALLEDERRRDAGIRDAAARKSGPLADELADLAEQRARWLRNGDDLPPGVIRIVRGLVRASSPLRVGDWIGDRRGFGGPVARVVADVDMPRAEGGLAEVVLPGDRVPPGTQREAQLAQGVLYLLRRA